MDLGRQDLGMRWLALSLALVYVSSVFIDYWQLKYFLLVALPWLYLLKGVPVYRPDGAIVFFYYLYSVSYPTFLLLGDGGERLEALLNVTNLGYAGIFLSVFVFFPKAYSVFHPKYNSGFGEFLGRFVRVLVPIMVLLSAFLLISKGITTKRQINDASGLFSLINVLVQLLYTYSTIYVAYLCVAGKRYVLGGGYLLFFALIYMLLVGERDIIFRYVFVLLLFWFSINGKFKSIYYIFGVLGLLVALSISQQAKNLLLTGSLYEAGESGVRWLFYNEFIAGSRNLHQILIHGNVFGEQNLILGDFIRFLSIFGLNENAQSATQWYNEYYRWYFDFSGQSGWGFGIVPELYYSFGDFGVVAGMFVIMSITTLLYNKLWAGHVGRVFVFIHYASFVYSFRADFANLLGLSIKWGAIAILLTLVGYLILVKAGKRDVRKS